MKLSEGCFLLRCNVTDGSGEELLRPYLQQADAEETSCLHETDLLMRPVWHHKHYQPSQAESVALGSVLNLR